MTAVAVGDVVRVSDEFTIVEKIDGAVWGQASDGRVARFAPSASFSVLRKKKVAPPKPKVGEVISGHTVRKTPWRAGTILVFVSKMFGDHISVRTLNANGTWTSVGDYETGELPFAGFANNDNKQYVVAYLPNDGK